MEEDVKPWYTSKTIIASILAPIWPSVAIILGQFHIVAPGIDIIVTDFAALGTIISAGIAIYGRLHATAPIGKKTS